MDLLIKDSVIHDIMLTDQVFCNPLEYGSGRDTVNKEGTDLIRVNTNCSSFQSVRDQI